MNLVINHVFQPLVVCWTNEDLCRHLTPGVTIVQHLCQTIIIKTIDIIIVIIINFSDPQ